MTDTVEIRDRYSTAEELGAEVKFNNPTLTGSDEAVGQWYAPRHGIIIGTPPTGTKHPLNAFIDATKEVVGTVAAPFDAASGAMGAVSQGMKDIGEGVGSGLSLGATDRLQEWLGTGTRNGVPIPTAEERSPMLFGAGQVLGEIMGPYRVANKILGLASTGKFLSKAPGAERVASSARLRQALGMGGEAALVEGTKTAIGTGDISDTAVNAAVGLALGGLAPAVVQGTGAGIQWGMRKWLHPKAGEVDTALKTFMEKWELPYLVSQLRPASTMVQGTMRRLTATTTTSEIMTKMRGNLVKAMKKMQQGVVGRLGDNAAVLPPSQVGRAIFDEIKGTQTFLRSQSKLAYDELRKTGIGETKISPNMKVGFERIGDEGEIIVEEGSLLGLLKDLVGGEGSTLSSGARKKLRNFYLEVKKAHTEPSPVYPSQSPDFVAGAEGMGINTATQNVPLKDYDWWWGRLQQIGEMMDSPKIKQNVSDMRVVKKAYHIVQDVIDAHAMAVTDAAGGKPYMEAITQARKLHMEHLSYAGNERVKAVLKLTEDTPGVTDYSSVVGRLFSSVDGLLDAKRLLGPEGFNQARQAWIRDLLFEGMERRAGSAEKYLSGRKMGTSFDKHGDIDGEFFKELFSEGNFFTPGEMVPLSVNTHAAEKFKMLQEVYDNVPKIEPAFSQLVSKGEQMQGMMTEKFSAAQLVQQGMNPKSVTKEALSYVRDLVVNLVLFRKASRIVFEQNLAKNPLLGGAIQNPIGMGGMPMGGSMALPQEEMYRGVSSVLNKMFNAPQ